MSDVIPLAPRADAEKRKTQVPPLAVDARRLARLLSAGVRTVRTWDAAGKLPRPFRLGGRTLWYLPEVRAWLRAGAPDRETWEVVKAARPKK